VRLVFKYALFVWIGTLALGFAMFACSLEDPKAVIANLPEINYPEKCYETGDCDRTIEHEVFSTLAKLSERHLKRGMSETEVEKIFGRPSYGGIDSWNDVRFGNPVTTWEYAASLSGTTAFYIIFVNDRLDDFGQMQISYMLWKYGKPGSSYGDDPVMQYRFRGREPG
jgi:hypothetical protein